MKPDWVAAVVGVALAGWAAVPAGAGSTKPNVLILHTDEHSFRTLGSYRALARKEQAQVWGRDVAVDTPHIDSLTRRGALCDRFYAASPVCTPSRASFVSGRYPQNTGASANNLPMRDDVVTFAEVLRQQGLEHNPDGRKPAGGSDPDREWPGLNERRA